MKHYYYTIKLVVGDEEIHSELVKVHDKDGHITVSGHSTTMYRIRDMVLSTLYSRDSMSPYSPVRVFRQQSSLKGKRLEYVVTPFEDLSSDPEVRFEEEKQLKTIERGYLLNHSLVSGICGYLFNHHEQSVSCLK